MIWKYIFLNDCNVRISYQSSEEDAGGAVEDGAVGSRDLMLQTDLKAG